MASERSLVERATKIAVLASTIGAIALGARQASFDIQFFLWLTIGAAIASYAASRKYADRLGGMIFALGYLLPVMLLLATGYRAYYLALWAAALFGVMASTMRLDWELPVALRFPLVVWALCIALTWPIVAARALDWNVSLLWKPSLVRGDADHSLSSTVFISQAALAHLLGILWMEWLCARFGKAPPARFRQLVAYPALAAAVCGALFAAYQGLANLEFLSIGGWSALGRATGQLADGNASGALTAMWVPIAIGFALQRSSLPATVGFGLSASVLTVATYVTGSRTAMLCAIAGSAVVLVAGLRDRAARSKVFWVGGILALVAVVGFVLMPVSITGPVERAGQILPGLSLANVRSALQQLWDRQGYGVAGLAVIRENPVQGIGVGVFNLIGADYYFYESGARIITDNAQNWFRHQLAELGLLGSVGWIVWCVVLTTSLFKRPAAETDRMTSLAVKGGLVGFGLASLLGMPSQNLVIALSVWSLAFWLLQLVHQVTPGASISRQKFMIALAASVIAVLFAGATVYAGQRHLRPPFIAKRLNYYYHYGIYDSMNDAQGTTQTADRAVVTMASPTKSLELTMWVEHPDADQRPVTVRVWIDRTLVVSSRFPRNVRLSRTFAVPGDGQRFVLETEVDRTYPSPPTARMAVGLNLDWRFVESP